MFVQVIPKSPSYFLRKILALSRPLYCLEKNGLPFCLTENVPPPSCPNTVTILPYLDLVISSHKALLPFLSSINPSIMYWCQDTCSAGTGENLIMKLLHSGTRQRSTEDLRHLSGEVQWRLLIFQVVQVPSSKKRSSKTIFSCKECPFLSFQPGKL